MQGGTLIQALWRDYTDRQPDISALDLWSSATMAEYLTLLTPSLGPWSAKSLIPGLAEHGYTPRQRYAMPERGLLLTLLATDMPRQTWLVLAEFQVATLSRQPRDLLQRLIDSADGRPETLPVGGRPWSMPTWEDYQALHQADPLAAWLAVMGTRVHHPGFDCDRLDTSMKTLDNQLDQRGYTGHTDRLQGVFPVSPLLDYRFYPGHPQRLCFAHGERREVSLGGLALIQRRVTANRERSVELLLPHHALCELG
ncbi:DUF1338 domain-containing protein [Halomonas sp. 18H]|uniref:DUF1338 domain-containing protein n=1 Tax=Halomonas almeriensis TaxID=308163 RepID=UPI002231A2BB|nr:MULTISPECIES: DUF1338 domain-containing protein [Halomonas]MCW4151819.1 DUF1338 domain-containing protein [Halomonas sp. 18H]MDN3554065.1 DUF1338 domain-containing protein [Halomonas almeriensis]